VGALLVIAALVYGFFIPRLGFYQDDWPIVWVYYSLGAKGVAVYFKGNREIAGKVFSIAFPIIGTSIFRWHVLVLLLRWLSSAFLFMGFRSRWPEREVQAWMVSAFALLYPGFSEQPMAVTFCPTIYRSCCSRSPFVSRSGRFVCRSLLGYLRQSQYSLPCSVT
jgi:hypothetical protein